MKRIPQEWNIRWQDIKRYEQCLEYVRSGKPSKLRSREVCAHDGCDEPVRAMNLCVTHYHRKRRQLNLKCATSRRSEEEDVEPGQPDCVHGEEVAVQDLVSVLVDELAPGPLTSTRGRRQTVAAEHFADGPVGAAMAQFDKLALDAPVTPVRVLLGQLHDESCNSLRRTGRWRRGRRL